MIVNIQRGLKPDTDWPIHLAHGPTQIGVGTINFKNTYQTRKLLKKLYKIHKTNPYYPYEFYNFIKLDKNAQITWRYLRSHT